jgi:Mlc titration factor MtfA (ptsG expression regulator)
MPFSWFKRRRRRQIRSRPFPEAWRQLLEQDVSFYRRLNETERAKLRTDLPIFVAEKNWEGCGGLILTDETKVTISAFVCLMTLGFEDEFFDHVKSILVYPTSYVAQGRTVTEGGLVIEGDSHREGEAWWRGPVIVAWDEAVECSRGESNGRNLVVHEFAHQLDMQNGQIVDGTPPLSSAEEFQRWQKVMNDEYEDLVERCTSGRHSLLDCYGATNIAEFFAVASETFFERPRALRIRHPALYEILQNYYRQNPAERTG